MDFGSWIMNKYKEWRDDKPGQSGSVSAYAKWLGDDSKGGQTVRDWLYNEQKPKHQKSIDALVKRYGYEIYDVLGIDPPENGALAWENLDPIQKLVAQYMQGMTHEEKQEMVEDAKRILEQRARNAGDEEAEARPHTGAA